MLSELRIILQALVIASGTCAALGLWLSYLYGATP